MMDRAIILLLLISIATIAKGFDRIEADSLTVQADRAYAAGDHELALQLYDSVLTEFTSAGLHYNIGNCYFKLQDVPRAILHYERALKLSPADENVQANLDLARLQIVDRVNEMPRTSLSLTISRIFGGSDLDQWAWRAVWIWVLTIAFLIAGWMARGTILRRILLSLAAVFFVATIAAAAFAYAGKARLEDDSHAIVLEPVIDVHSEPSKASTTLFVIHKGTKVKVLQQSEDWYEISLLNGNVGWIPSGTFEQI